VYNTIRMHHNFQDRIDVYALDLANSDKDSIFLSPEAWIICVNKRQVTVQSSVSSYTYVCI